MQLEIGSIVCSKAGRDCNMLSIVIKNLDNGYVQTVDGKNRKISNPKLKNSKHLKLLAVDHGLAEKINSGLNILDAEIRSCIKGAEQNYKMGGN